MKALEPQGIVVYTYDDQRVEQVLKMCQRMGLMTTSVRILIASLVRENTISLPQIKSRKKISGEVLILHAVCCTKVPPTKMTKTKCRGRRKGVEDWK